MTGLHDEFVGDNRVIVTSCRPQRGNHLWCWVHDAAWLEGQRNCARITPDYVAAAVEARYGGQRKRVPHG